jgi:hypothetical protein
MREHRLRPCNEFIGLRPSREPAVCVVATHLPLREWHLADVERTGARVDGVGADGVAEDRLDGAVRGVGGAEDARVVGKRRPTTKEALV